MKENIMLIVIMRLQNMLIVENLTLDLHLGLNYFLHNFEYLHSKTSHLTHSSAFDFKSTR